MQEGLPFDTYVFNIIFSFIADAITYSKCRLVCHKWKKHADVYFLELLLQSGYVKDCSRVFSLFSRLPSYDVIYRNRVQIGISGVLLWRQLIREFPNNLYNIRKKLKNLRAAKKRKPEVLERKYNTIQRDINDGIFGRGRRSKNTDKVSDEDWSYNQLETYAKRIKETDKALNSPNKERELIDKHNTIVKNALWLDSFKKRK